MGQTQNSELEELLKGLTEEENIGFNNGFYISFMEISVCLILKNLVFYKMENKEIKRVIETYEREMV